MASTPQKLLMGFKIVDRNFLMSGPSQELLKNLDCRIIINSKIQGATQDCQTFKENRFYLLYNNNWYVIVGFRLDL